jgi:uncharacterized protein
MSDQGNDAGHDSGGAAQSAPRIAFPCAYPIKIMGSSSASFISEVVQVCRTHAPATEEKHVTVRPSSKGNYTAVTVVIQATGVEQLERLFADLKTIDGIKMVL